MIRHFALLIVEMIWSTLLFSSFALAAASNVANTVYGPVEGHAVANGVIEWLVSRMKDFSSRNFR